MLVGSEVKRVLFALSARVMVHRPTGKLAVPVRPVLKQCFEKSARPIDIVVIRAGANQLQVLSILGNPGSETPELGGIILGSEVSAASPAFIAYTPVPHVKGLRESRLGPQLRKGG